MITAYGDAETKRKFPGERFEALVAKPIDFGALRFDTRVERLNLHDLAAAQKLACWLPFDVRRGTSFWQRREE